MFTLSSSLQFPSNLNKMQFIKQCIDFFLYLKQYNPYSFIHSFILVELPFKGRRTDIRGADWHFPFIFHKDSSPSQYSYINLLSGVRHHFYTSFLPSPPTFLPPQSYLPPFSFFSGYSTDQIFGYLHLSVHMYLLLSTYIDKASVCLSIQLCMKMYTNICLSIHLSINLSIFLSCINVFCMCCKENAKFCHTLP